MKQILKVNPLGWCKGVETAYQKMIDLVKNNMNYHFYLCGPIIHNKKTNNDLKKIGVTILNEKNGYLKKLQKIAKNDPKAFVVFPAHGVNKQELEYTKQHFQKYQCLTCQLVNEIETKIIEKLDNHYEIIYFGIKNHAEAISAKSINEKHIHIVLDDNDIKKIKHLKNKKIFFCSQSTMLKDKYLNTLKNIKKIFPKVESFDFLCPYTTNRQENLNKVIKKADFLIIVSDKQSNNGNQLLKIAKANKIPAILTLNTRDLKNINFNSINTCLITSATSSSKKQVDEIENYLKTQLAI